MNVSGAEGSSTGTVTVATFTDLGGTEELGDYSATIDWGGTGSGSTTGTIIANIDGSFSVQGSFTYAEEGSYTVSVHIVHENGIVADTTSTATVVDATLTGSSAATATGGVEGLTPATLSGATFTDANAGDHTADFTATITWGDTGPTSLGTVSYDSVTQTYSVAGSHTYAEEGSYNISIAVVDVGGSSTTITGTATVADAALSSTPGDLTPPTATEGAAFGPVTVFHFTDADPAGTASDYSALVTLGDGNTVTLTSTPGANGQIVASGGGFDVQLSYTYAQELTAATFSVLVTDHNAMTSQSTSAFSVADAAPSVAADHGSVTQPEGTTVTNTGTFSDYDEAVTIMASTGNVTQSGSQSGTWSWSGPAASDTPYSVTITATNADHTVSTTTFNVTFTDVPPTITNNNPAVSTPEDAAAANAGTWADFDDASGLTLSASQGTVTKHNNGTWSWSQLGDETNNGTVTITATNGDGTTATTSFTVTFNDVPPNIAESHSSVGPVAEGAAATNNGTFGDYDDAVTITASTGTVMQVNDDSHGNSGTWTWSGTGDEGTQTVTITATNADGHIATSSFTVTYTDAPLTGSNGATAGGTEGIANSSVLSGATFTDANPGDNSADFTATIHWGDSQTSTGTVSYDSVSHVYSVNGSHTYVEEASYPISISIVDDGGQTTTVTGTAIVGDASLTASPTTITPTEGSLASVTGVTVATFTDAAGSFAHRSDFTATITWGDGGTTASYSIVDDGNGNFHVVATKGEAYAEEGTYTVHVSIVDDGGSTASTDSSAIVSDPNVVATGVNAFSLTEGSATLTNATVATFTDPGGAEDPNANYSATIGWGDGTSGAGVVISDGHGGFIVQGTHTYSGDTLAGGGGESEGAATITVTISHDATTPQVVTDTANIGDPNVAAVGVPAFSLSEGSATLNNVLLATFSDPGNPSGAAEDAADYSATISWGDGSNPDTATI
ncbi:MAG TPA: hypothetical protein VG125_22530, partial [Pirellulales bacterium]|nr:hypothetical protein [Pirellulales bacterium]